MSLFLPKYIDIFFTIVSGISDADLMTNIISRYTIWSEKTIVFVLYKYADIDFYHFHVNI